MFNKNKASVNPEDKLPLGKFFIWKLRDISLAAVTVIVSGYMMLFATSQLGLSASLVGTLILVSRIFDGFTDLIAGYIVDNTNTRFGKARPYEIFIIFIWLATIAFFSASPEWSDAAKAIWVFVMYTFIFSICQTFLSANGTPYTISAFKGNRTVITKLSSYGGLVSMIGSVAVSISFPRIMHQMASSGQTGYWQKLVLTFAVPLMVMGILRMIFVKEEGPTGGQNKSNEKVTLKQILAMIKTNTYVWYYAAILGFFNLTVGFGVGTFYFIYVVGDISKFGFVGMASLLTLPIMFVFPKLMRKYSVSFLYKAGALITILGQALVFFSAEFNNNPIMLFSGTTLASLVALPVSYLQILVIMNLAQYNEYMNLPRLEATITNVGGFTSKLFTGLGTALTGILLGASGFVTGAGDSVAAQPDSAIFMIRCLYSLLPLVNTVAIYFFSTKYSGLEKKMPEIKEEMAKRQAA